MEKIEGMPVEFAILASRMGKPLNCEVFLQLANNCIEGTSTKEAVVAWKQKIKSKNMKLGNQCYNQFMKCNQDQLDRVRGKMKDINQELWGTYQNIEIMCNIIYKWLKDVGHTRKLDHPI
jgi:pectate lyase